LPVGEASGFIFVGVDTTEFFTVSIIDGDQPMMMLATAVLIEGGFFVSRAAFRWGLGHGAILLMLAMMRTIANNGKFRKYRTRY
jgi:hypothetical protein